MKCWKKKTCGKLSPFQKPYQSSYFPKNPTGTSRGIISGGCRWGATCKSIGSNSTITTKPPRKLTAGTIGSRGNTSEPTIQGKFCIVSRGVLGSVDSISTTPYIWVHTTGGKCRYNIHIPYSGSQVDAEESTLELLMKINLYLQTSVFFGGR